MQANSSGLEVKNEKEWVILAVKDRVDSFNWPAFKAELDKIVAGSPKNLALDLSRAKFLSLICIKSICSAADALKKQGGNLTLVSASEKLKRQFHIYASLNELNLARSPGELRASAPGDSGLTATL